MNIAVTPPKGPTNAPIGTTGASMFSMRGAPLLSDGASFDGLAAAENLWLSLKVYSSGGENAFHAHTAEDHAFVVMQGRGTFHFPDGTTQDVKQFEGIMLPKNVYYRFEADPESNLVLLRIGAMQRTTEWVKGKTLDLDGSLKDGRNPKTGTPSRPIVPIPGRFFAAE